MKHYLLSALLSITTLASQAQATILKANKSLSFTGIELNGKALLLSDIDNTLWATDGTAGNTVQLSSSITADDGVVLNGKYIFVGEDAASGKELFITDGTPAGTKILKDIVPGVNGSTPDDQMTIFNNKVYFSAEDAEHGREVWSTDGTTAGTGLFKDIVAGAGSSNLLGDYEFFSNGSFILFTAEVAGKGKELYKSDGTPGGTQFLVDINPGAASSDAAYFRVYNNTILFLAKTDANGSEIWKTDGTAAGTKLVKDIYVGSQSGVDIPFFLPFNDKLVFTATTADKGEELWVTDGTETGTHIVKDINPGTGSSSSSLFSSIIIGNKMIFTASDQSISFGTPGFPDLPTNSELWVTDGTEAGTHIFKDIVEGDEGSSPFIIPNIIQGTFNASLFHGNQFFFMATTPEKGTELWISDGTSGGTHMVKDINAGEESGLTSFSFLYTSEALYFAADDGVHGNELWKSDGTLDGTVMVSDLNKNAANTDSDVQFGIFINGQILFTATNGDNPNFDLYRLDGTFTPLPVVLSSISVFAEKQDALIKWSTVTEVNTRDFKIMRSLNGSDFTNVGTVAAAVNSTQQVNYTFLDKNVTNLASDVVYYKIIATDVDGKATASRIVSLNLNKKQWFVKVLDNPVTSQIRLQVKVSQPVQIFVTDMSGRVVYKMNQQTANGIISIPTSTLVSGIYSVVVEGANERAALKIVKQ